MSHSILSQFGEMVFNDKKMKKSLCRRTYKQFHNSIDGNNKELIDLALANKIANAMKKWAVKKGATHFTHWFQPLNGVTAEKHESFLVPNNVGTAIMSFSGKELIKGETDGSSFPSGGLRSTFEARGYTAWDASSFAFIKNNTLYIPTIFLTYSGQVLDSKTPLHRSSTAIKEQAKRLVRLFGKQPTRARVTVGAEQEYFLISKEMYDQRLDLKLTGRTLFGASSPKTQELENHYYGDIKTPVMKFMIDLDRELWRLGIPAKTRHNEVAPCQHELACTYERVSVATDHNQIVMEIMRKVAERHNLVCLLHEKPFTGMNGSGKHNNWSVTTNATGNLLDPGSNPETNYCFLLFLVCVMTGVNEHADLLRLSVASAGNDHRLGGNEAPPAIISIFLGEEVSSILEAMASNKIYTQKVSNLAEHGVKFVPNFIGDRSDRNRTSPFAFTGTKFEFRMPGSSTNISCANIMLNTAVADVIKRTCDVLEKNPAQDKIKEMIVKLYKENKQILFDGNGYSAEWQAEAQKRGLFNLKSTPEAVVRYTAEKNIALFKRHGIFTESEAKAREHIALDEYCNTIKIEAATMLEMYNRQIFPSILRIEKELTKLINEKNQLKVNTEIEMSYLNKISEAIVKTNDLKSKLAEGLTKFMTIENLLERAKFCCNEILIWMKELRLHCDRLESRMPKRLWPIPLYSDILFAI